MYIKEVTKSQTPFSDSLTIISLYSFIFTEITFKVFAFRISKLIFSYSFLIFFEPQYKFLHTYRKQRFALQSKK